MKHYISSGLDLTDEWQTATFFDTEVSEGYYGQYRIVWFKKDGQTRHVNCSDRFFEDIYGDIMKPGNEIKIRKLGKMRPPEFKLA